MSYTGRIAIDQIKIRSYKYQLYEFIIHKNDYFEYINIHI